MNGWIIPTSILRWDHMGSLTDETPEARFLGSETTWLSQMLRRQDIRSKKPRVADDGEGPGTLTLGNLEL